jgi:photosystem II stability/assembly factor-like uncharacterized protein
LIVRLRYENLRNLACVLAMGEEQFAANYTREMELRPYWKTRWLMIALLMLPTLVWCGYSLLHPNTKKNGDKLYRLIEVPVHAEQTSPWVMQESGTKAGLRGIDSVDGKIAWASGTGGTVLKTIDGGEHWQKCAVPDGDKDGATLDFRGVQAWNAQTAIVMSSGPGDRSRLYKTADGCGSWRLVLTNPDKDGFWDSYRGDQHGHLGILVGDPVRNHFPLWQVDRDDSSFQIKRFKHEPRAQRGEAAFAASNSAIFVDDVFFDFWLATGGTGGARVIKRINHDFDSFGFETFPSALVPVGHNTKSSGIFGLSFRKTPETANPERHFMNGIAVGGDYTKPDESTATAAWTSDGGLHWTAATKPPHGYRSSVAWNEGLKAWITVGTNGSDISRDDGKTWQPLDDGNWNALSLPFVVGPKGRIARLSQIPTK